jgi:hypothetical protein
MFMARSMKAAPSPLPVVPERIAEIIFALCQTVSMRLRMRTVSQAQVTYIVGRLLGIRKRFQRLVARIRAGHPPLERARIPREAAPAPEFPLGFRPPPPGWRRWAMPADKPLPLWRSLRQHTFAWLLPLAPNVPEFRDSAAGHRAWLLALLEEPETQALLLASRRVGDTLRPLCWMLGIEVSVLYPARPVAGAAVVSVVDAVPVDAVAADNRVSDPVTDETAIPAFATHGVATMGTIMAAETEFPLPRPRARDGDEFFAMA